MKPWTGWGGGHAAPRDAGCTWSLQGTVSLPHPLISEDCRVQGALGRPGNLYQDSLSAISNLGPDYFAAFHTYGVDWQPGQYLRWYIDDVLLYEVNTAALVQQTNGSGARVHDCCGVCY